MIAGWHESNFSYSAYCSVFGLVVQGVWRTGIKGEVPFPPKLPDIPLYLVKIEKIGAKSVFMFTLIKRNADCRIWSGLRYVVEAIFGRLS